MQISFEPLADHLLVTASGRFDAGMARDTVAEIARRCADGAFERVLVDFRGVTDLVSIADRYDLGKVLADARLPGRIAILVAPAQRFTSTLEDTAVNRGAKLRTTASEADARAFLGLG